MTSGAPCALWPGSFLTKDYTLPPIQVEKLAERTAKTRIITERQTSPTSLLTSEIWLRRFERLSACKLTGLASYPKATVALRWPTLIQPRSVDSCLSSSRSPSARRPAVVKASKAAGDVNLE